MGTIVLILIASGALAGGYYLWNRSRAESREKASEHSSDSRKSREGLLVEVVHPTQGGIELTTNQAGSVHPFESAALYSKVSGYLKVQNVDIGDHVTRGQLLAVIEDPEVDKAVDQNQALLDQSMAKVKVAEAKIRSAQAAKAASESMVKQSELMVNAKLSNQELQDKQLKRIAGLVARNAVEQKLEDEQKDRFDVAVADVGVARAETMAARSEVLSKEALVQESQADLIEAQANVEVAQANLAKAKVMQDYIRITSPYEGVVTIRSFHRGDFIRSASEGGSLPVLAVARTDLMRLVLPIPDEFVPFVNKGDRAVFQIVALPHKTFEGKVARFSESEDAQSRNMRTEVDLPNPDGLLREGMYGRVNVTLQQAAPDSVTIPSTGLVVQRGNGQGSLYIVKDGKAHKVDVRVGNDTGIQCEIMSGISIKDEVIFRYNGSLGEGTPVKPEVYGKAKSSH